MKSFLPNNNIKIYLTHNEGKSIVVKTFVRTLKNKFYKYITSISKNIDIDILDDIVNKIKNTYSTIKMKLVDVKSNTYINSSKEMQKILKLKLVILIEHKNIFAKGSVPNGSEEVFMIKKIIKTLCYGHMLLVILTEEKLVESFRKKNCKKQIKKSLELKKQLKEKMINHTLNGKATIILLTIVNDVMCKCVNEWIFCITKIFKTKSEHWIRFI